MVGYTNGVWNEVNNSQVALRTCRNGIYEQIFQMLLSERYELKKLNLSICSIDTDSIPAKKGET